jgi:hypothetical protein
LTLVVPLRPDTHISALATAGLDSIALRVPSHPVAREILQAASTPIVAPSANRSGRVSPTEADHVWADLNGRIDAIVEGWSTPVGVESTIVSCLGAEPSLLRPGGVTREEIERALGHALAEGSADAEKPVAPGLLESHYAPQAAVRLNATATLHSSSARNHRQGSMPPRPNSISAIAAICAKRRPISFPCCGGSMCLVLRRLQSCLFQTKDSAKPSKTG